MEGSYTGIQDLVEMQKCVLQESPAEWQMINSPLSERVERWEALLAPHPDQRFKDVIITGLRRGFHIGFQPQLVTLKSAKHNLLSCAEHPQVVEDYIAKECKLGRLAGPFIKSTVPQIHISPFGVIPKKASGAWRLIVDLSSPHDHSTNDGITPAWSSLTYVTVDAIAERVMSMGQGTWLAKLDIKSAFRIIPVHPSDRYLLGVEWKQAVYVDTVLPFGLRSAPKLFNAIADALQFIARASGIENIVHYLDDFVILGAPGINQCALDLQLLETLCETLGVPLAPEKKEGPSTRLEILGIIVDSIKMQLSLPEKEAGRDQSKTEVMEGSEKIDEGRSAISCGHLTARCKSSKAREMLHKTNL